MPGCRAWDDETCTRILAKLGENPILGLRDQCIFTFGIRTGYRISEILSCRVSDVCTIKQAEAAGGDRQVEMLDSVRLRIEKQHDHRHMLMTPHVKLALMNWLNSLHGRTLMEGDALFPGSQVCGKDHGERRFRRDKAGHAAAMGSRSFWVILKKACADCGIKGPKRTIATHCLRKSFAKKMYKALGQDLVSLQKALRHKALASTLHYVDTHEDQVNEAVMTLDSDDSVANAVKK